jgi:uncharacterized membrane protein YphA (DoxX/SURF4 family)
MLSQILATNRRDHDRGDSDGARPVWPLSKLVWRRKGNGYEYHLLAIALAMVVIVEGAGALSVDRLLYVWMVA